MFLSVKNGFIIKDNEGNWCAAADGVSIKCNEPKKTMYSPIARR